MLGAKSMKTPLGAAMMLFLTACETGRSFSPILPEITTYTPAEQMRATAEMGTCDSPMLRRMMRDYGALRDKIRSAR